MNKRKVLASGLMLWVGSLYAQPDADGTRKKHQEPETTTPHGAAAESGDKWDLKAGFLIETENVEGKTDRKGLWEPTLYLEALRGDWTLYGSLYQENHNVAQYYGVKGRSDWFNQYEFNVRYQLLSRGRYESGLMAGVRNYQWQYQREMGKAKRAYHSWRYTLQPDWRVQFTDNFVFSGWLASYRYLHNVHNNALPGKELESEAGWEYRLNNRLSVALNYYIDRGWSNSTDRRGEFSQQELRVYLPLILSPPHVPETLATPYLRRTLRTYYYNDERRVKEGETDTRFGLLLQQSLPCDLTLSLEYALELQHYHAVAGERAGDGKYHYTGFGMVWQF